MLLSLRSSYVSNSQSYDLVPIFFFNDTATTEIYTLSLHDALPIYPLIAAGGSGILFVAFVAALLLVGAALLVSLWMAVRSEEHTSELQSRQYLVCRLLLEKKKKQNTNKQILASERKDVHRPENIY